MAARDRFLLSVLQFVEALNLCLNKRIRSFILLFHLVPVNKSMQLSFKTRSREDCLNKRINIEMSVTVCSMYVLLTFQKK